MIMGMSRGPQETTYKYLQSLKPDPRKVRTSEFPRLADECDPNVLRDL